MTRNSTFQVESKSKGTLDVLQSSWPPFSNSKPNFGRHKLKPEVVNERHTELIW